MRGFHRLGLGILLLFAALVAQPLLHQHPLIPEGAAPGSSSPPCAFCAIGADRILTAPPPSAPVAVLYLLVTRVAATPAAGVAVAVLSRGPPSGA